MPNILFVCTANQFRSPIAAAYFSHKIAEQPWKSNWIVKSAGTNAFPGVPALPAAVAIGMRLELSLLDHLATLVTRELLSTQSLILVMEKNHKESLCAEFPFYAQHIFLLSEIALGKSEDIVDPVIHAENNYLETAVKICRLIDAGFYRICAMAINPKKIYAQANLMSRVY